MKPIFCVIACFLGLILAGALALGVIALLALSNSRDTEALFEMPPVIAVGIAGLYAAGSLAFSIVLGPELFGGPPKR